MVTVEPTFPILIFAVIILVFVGSGIAIFSSKSKEPRIAVGIVLAISLPIVLAVIAGAWSFNRSHGVPHYSPVTIQHPPTPDFSAHDSYVADIYSSSEEAAKSLARQLTKQLLSNAELNSPILLTIDREQSANAGRGVTETAMIIQAVEEELRANNTALQLTDNSSDAISLAIRRLSTEDNATQSLSMSYELDGKASELSASFVDKIWVRHPSDLARRPGAPKKYFVASGPGSEHEDSVVINQVTAAITPLVRVNGHFISNLELGENTLGEVARELVTDRFSQSLVNTVAGTPLEPADKKLFLLVDYSDENVENILRRVSASAPRVSSIQTGGSYRSLLSNLASLGVLSFIVAMIYLVLRAITDKWNPKRELRAVHHGQ